MCRSYSGFDAVCCIQTWINIFSGKLDLDEQEAAIYRPNWYSRLRFISTLERHRAMNYWRSLFQYHPPNISKEQAIAIAKEECKQRGWWWGMPIKVSQRRKAWVIHTNWKMRGMNARFRVDNETGEVKEAAYLPR